MDRFVVIGDKNNGKTLFCKNFTKSLGGSKIYSKGKTTHYEVVIKDKKILLIDTITLIEDNSPIKNRKYIVETLDEIINADGFIHILDNTKEIISHMDNTLYNYGKTKKNYLILLNKCDKTNNIDMMKKLLKENSNLNILNISAKKNIGLNNVKISLRHMTNCDKIHRKNYFGW